MFICRENILLEEAKTQISYDFEYEFLGRKVNSHYKNNMDLLETAYLRNSEYSLKGIYFSNTLELDKDGCLCSISFNKYKDRYAGHGRPISDELTVSAKDKNEIRKYLNDSLAETQEDDYKSLINTLKNKNKIKNYKLVDISAKGIILNNGSDILVPKKELLKILNLSHTYIDILYNANLYKNNVDLVDAELVKPLLAIFSYYDYSNYPNIKTLEHEADIRKICLESESGYKKLLKALKNSDIENVKKYAKYSIVVTQSSKDEEKPMIFAVKFCPESVKTLLNAGCFANPSYWYKDKSGISKVETAIGIAYKNKDYKSLKLIANCFDPAKAEHKPFVFNDNGSYDAALRMYNASVRYCLEESFNKKALEILIPHMDKSLKFEFQKNYEFTYEQIAFLSSYDGLRIEWEAKDFERVYSTNKDVCMNMLKQGCKISTINTFIDLDDYDLFKYCAENYTEGQSYYFEKDSFIKLFSKPAKWYKIARELEKHNFNFTEEYIKELKNSNQKKYEVTVQKYNLNKDI